MKSILKIGQLVLLAILTIWLTIVSAFEYVHGNTFFSGVCSILTVITTIMFLGLLYTNDIFGGFKYFTK